MATPRVLDLDIVDPIHEPHLDKKSYKDSKEAFDIHRKKMMITYESLMHLAKTDRDGFTFEVQRS